MNKPGKSDDNTPWKAFGMFLFLEHIFINDVKACSEGTMPDLPHGSADVHIDVKLKCEVPFGSFEQGIPCWHGIMVKRKMRHRPHQQIKIGPYETVRLSDETMMKVGIKRMEYHSPPLRPSARRRPVVQEGSSRASFHRA